MLVASSTKSLAPSLQRSSKSSKSLSEDCFSFVMTLCGYRSKPSTQRTAASQLAHLFRDDSKAEADTMSWITSIYWLLDIPASFLVGHAILEARKLFQMVSGHLSSLQEGTVEMRITKIAHRYFRTWFIFDVVIVGTSTSQPGPWPQLRTGLGLADLDAPALPTRLRLLVGTRAWQ